MDEELCPAPGADLPPSRRLRDRRHGRVHPGQDGGAPRAADREGGVRQEVGGEPRPRRLLGLPPLLHRSGDVGVSARPPARRRRPRLRPLSRSATGVDAAADDGGPAHRRPGRHRLPERLEPGHRLRRLGRPDGGSGDARDLARPDLAEREHVPDRERLGVQPALGRRRAGLRFGAGQEAARLGPDPSHSGRAWRRAVVEAPTPRTTSTPSAR